jgi:tyrosyl-tRNA synthetase
MNLSEELQWRGLIKDKTFTDISYLDTPKTFYLGVDCNSAPSMTIGNLAIFMTARRLLDAGWNTVLLVGGATSLIGDPGGKDDERALKSSEEIASNVASIKAQVERLFAGKKFTMVDNYDWFKDIGYLEFLRDVGKHYSMTELVQRDYISNRMGEGGAGISYAEFSYNLIQGYDFWYLYKNHSVELQLGGSDQWGNMLSGVPLIRKKENTEVHAMSTPLVINKATGKKFGKSEGGAIWLDPDLTSPYQFYQFWLNVDDVGVEDYLKIYTLKNMQEINEIMAKFNANTSGRYAQKVLSYEVTKIVHGKDRADSVKRISEVLFGGAEYKDLKEPDFVELSREIGVVKANTKDLADIMVKGGLASSKSEARRFVNSGAVYANGQQLAKDTSELASDTSISGYMILRRGKNMQTLVEVS